MQEINDDSSEEYDEEEEEEKTCKTITERPWEEDEETTL